MTRASVPSGAMDGPPVWHAMTVADTLAALEADPERGLTGAEAAERRERLGPNLIGQDEGPSRLGLLLEQFRDVLQGFIPALSRRSTGRKSAPAV